LDRPVDGRIVDEAMIEDDDEEWDGVELAEALYWRARVKLLEQRVEQHHDSIRKLWASLIFTNLAVATFGLLGLVDVLYLWLAGAACG